MFKKLAKMLVFSVILFTLILPACVPTTPTTVQAPASTETQAVPVVQPTEAPRGILTYSREGNTIFTRNFNPFSPVALYGTTTVIYERLIIFNPVKGEIVPWLATGYEWGQDGKSLVFKLRDNVKWSDGEPFGANDVAMTFEILKKDFAGGGMDYVDSVEVVDPLTAKFVFNRPYSMALYEVGQQVIVPEHIWKTIEDPVKFMNENPVGTGPFTEVAVFQSQVYELHRNNSYWQEGKPYIEGIRIPAYPGNDQANLATVNGENDWADQFMQEIDKVYVSKDPENNHYWFATTGGMVQLILNQTRKPFDDPIVRKAISMAIDREQVIKIGMFGYTHPADATGLSDAFENWKDKSLLAGGDWTKLDVAKANQMLDDAGYKLGADGIRKTQEGKPMKFELIVGAPSTDWVADSQVIAQNLKDIGIEVTVNAQDWGLVIERKQKGDFDMAHSWSGHGATPYFYYRSVFDCDFTKPVGEVTNENYHRGCNEEATKLLTEFTSTFDEAEQRVIIQKVEKLFYDEAPTVPLFPSPEWGEYNTTRFTGFPTAENPYALLQGRANTSVIVWTTVKPK